MGDVCALYGADTVILTAFQLLPPDVRINQYEGQRARKKTKSLLQRFQESQK